MITFIDSLEARRLMAVDLICYGVQIDSYDPSKGLISYTIAIANSGTTNPPFNAGGAIFLSKNQAVNDGDDIRIAPISPLDTPRLSNKFLKGTAQIPATADPAAYYLGAALDIDNNAEELSNNNNYSFSANTITVPKSFDLTVDGTNGDDVMIVDQPTNSTISIRVNKTIKTYALDRIASLTLNGLSGNDIIRALPTLNLPLLINGGNGHDSIDGAAAGDTLNGGKGRDTIHGGGGSDRIYGNADNDILFGDSKGDRIWGGAGDDFIDGNGGDDRIDGGAGKDTLLGSGGNDIITAKDGEIDSIVGGSDNDKADLDLADLRSGVEVIT
jgi:Ca2+-binding RTX toxin-like protein